MSRSKCFRSFASDCDRLTRFTREAQTLASLNHPTIGDKQIADALEAAHERASSIAI
jgi:hypothetical protein